MKKIHVLLVDDSPLMLSWLKKILSADPEIGEVTTARDPYAAMTSLQAQRPDVITLDVEMPGMNGISFLKKIMSAHPLPVVMVSAYTQKNCQTTIKALSLGAVDFIPKPGPGSIEARETFPQRLLIKVKEAAQARAVSSLPAPSRLHRPGIEPVRHPAPGVPGLVVGIGASTGGTQALTFLLSQLPEDTPPIIIVQHIPPRFTPSFAAHLDQVSLLTVKEAGAGYRLNRGLVLVAPGGKHCAIRKDQQGLYVTLSEDPPVNHHRPSVDVLFHSLAVTVQEQGIGILMTGMGDDGARGLLAMRRQGARTLVQDESTSTIFGMPLAALRLGAAQQVAPLGEISTWLIGNARA